MLFSVKFLETLQYCDESDESVKSVSQISQSNQSVSQISQFKSLIASKMKSKLFTKEFKLDVIKFTD